MWAEFWRFFSHRNSIHIVTLTFEPIPKQQIRIFTNFLTNQNKYGQSSLFTFYYVFWQKQSDWKMLCKVRIRSFGIGCWIRWARYWWLKMNMYTLLTVNLFYLFFFLLYRCATVGVNIYVDAVMNHMSGNDRTGKYIWIMNR